MKQAVHDLNQGPVVRQLLQQILPLTLGLLLMLLFGVADAWFAGRLGAEAQAALATGSTVFYLLVALAYGYSQSTAVFLGQAHAAGQVTQLRPQLLHALVGALSVAGILGGMAAIGLEGLLQLLGGGGVMARLYLKTLLPAVPLFYLLMVLYGAFNGLGLAVLFSRIMLASFGLGLLCNAWLFLWSGWAPGLVGLAWTTLLVQSVALLWGGYLLWRHLPPSGVGMWPLQPALLGPWFKLGTLAGLTFLFIAGGTYVLFVFIQPWGAVAQASALLVLRLEQLWSMPVIALGYAVLGMVAQAQGAGLPERVREVWRSGLWIGMPLSLLFAAALYGLAPALCAGFTTEPAVLAQAIQGVRIMCWCALGYVLMLVSGQALQGLQRPLCNFLGGLSRHLLLQPLLFWWATQHVASSTSLWWSILLAALLVGACMVLVAWRQLPGRASRQPVMAT